MGIIEIAFLIVKVIIAFWLIAFVYGVLVTVGGILWLALFDRDEQPQAPAPKQAAAQVENAFAKVAAFGPIARKPSGPVFSNTFFFGIFGVLAVAIFIFN